MIEVDKLCVSLNNREILADISFSLDNGNNLVILGRSGSGKTVLIKTLLGIYSPVSGSVIIDGIDIHRSTEEQRKATKKRFAMVFQNAALLDSFTVLQNVALPLYERGEKDAILIKERVYKCLQMVGLENTVNLYPAELSGGMRKRIGIARALVYEPDYIIFDEPVSGLDPITSREIMFYITRIVETASATLITITHELKDIQTIGNQILFLDAGRVVFNGKTNDLSQSPDPLLQEYLQ
ncbi:MAG TPA: ATP-binding cassette domain-containing protein [Candidatus Cloacimonas sp.]|nr:ATP-binding cassette domain-containing protein [Candidatus Cloacimonas sp.]